MINIPVKESGVIRRFYKIFAKDVKTCVLDLVKWAFQTSYVERIFYPIMIL